MEEAEEEEEEETPQEERQHTMEGRVVASREREREGESACGSSGSANTKRAARAKSEPHSEGTRAHLFSSPASLPGLAFAVLCGSSFAHFLGIAT